MIKTPSNRGRKREPKLSEQDIMDCALRLIRADGVEQLSMRRLATHLNVTPMAFYHYVKDKDDLLERVYDSILLTMETPTPSRVGWRVQLRELALGLYGLLSTHAGLARFMLGRLPTAQGRRIIRYQIEVLLAAGFDERSAALGISALNTMMFGTLAAELQLVGQRSAIPRSNNSAAAVSPLGRVAAHLASLNFSEWSEFALDTVLDSLALQLKHSAPSKKSSRKRAQR